MPEPSEGRGRFAFAAPSLAGNRTVGILLAAGIVLLLAAVAYASVTFVQNAAATQEVEHTLEVETAINQMAALNEQLETARRGYLIGAGSSFRANTERAELRFDTELTTLATLVRDNPRQAVRLERIAGLQRERKVLLRQLFASEAARREMMSGRLDLDRSVLIARAIRAIAADMVGAEASLLSQRNQRQYESLLRLYVVAGAAIILLVLVLGAVIALILRYNRSLNAAQEVLRRANESLEDAVAARTAELQRANQEIQRFAYIVSHDLRSPLVNVLGFTAELDEARTTVRKFLADLFDRQPELRNDEAWRAVEEDLPEALGFIRTSTEKMDRLINSILQLSRQGRRPLTPEPLDMNAVVGSVVATLHQRALDAGAKVIVKSIPPLESDRLTVEQILSNLIENAIKYASPNRPGEVTIEGHRAGAMVHIDVIDNGRGIDPKDHERIFELFRRSGAQDQPGEGIGLANVRALAYRLGGLIEVDSQLDHGARFRLSLPAKFVATESIA